LWYQQRLVSVAMFSTKTLVASISCGCSRSDSPLYIQYSANRDNLIEIHSSLRAINEQEQNTVWEMKVFTNEIGNLRIRMNITDFNKSNRETNQRDLTKETDKILDGSDLRQARIAAKRSWVC